MRSSLVPAYALKYKSHGISPGDKVYLGSNSVGGLALSDAEVHSVGALGRLWIAHSWSNDHPSCLILWLTLPSEVDLLNCAKSWERPTLELHYRRLTYHSVTIQGFAWLERYVKIILSLSGPMSEKLLQLASSRAQRGFETLSEDARQKPKWQVHGSPSSTAMSPYQALTKSLKELDSQVEEID